MRVTRLGGLKDILAGKKPTESIEEVPSSENGDTAESTVQEPSTALSSELFARVLEQLATHLESQDKKSAAAAIRLNGNHVKDGKGYIELMKHEMVIFNEIKQEVVQFIRTNTGIPNLMVEFELVLKSTKEAKPFRSKDKLDAMIKANPLLGDFINTFDLELED